MKVFDIERSEYYTSIITSFQDILDSTKRIESLFRNSKEYKEYIASVKEGLQIKHCAFFEDKDFTEVDLELHHIFRLYDIVVLVGTKLLADLDDNEFLTVYDIVNEVIKFHMKDYPSVMLLSSTLHQLHHTGQYELPKNSTSLHLGKYLDFIKEYKEFLSNDDFTSIKYFLSEKEIQEIDKQWEDQNSQK